MAPVTHAEEIDAAPQACFDALVAFETYPEWQSAVATAEVLGRDPAAATVDVAFAVDLRVRKVHYTLRYHLNPPHRLTWELVEGDVARVDGGYHLEELSPGRTRASYTLDIDPGFPVPGFLRRRLVQGAMADSVRELRERVAPDAA